MPSDNFDDNSFDTGIWTVDDPTGNATVTETGGRLSISPSTDLYGIGGTESTLRIYQDHDASSDWTISYSVDTSNVPSWQVTDSEIALYLMIGDGDTYLAHGLFQANWVGQGVIATSGYRLNSGAETTTHSVVDTGGRAQGAPSTVYVRIVKTGTSYDFDTSTDGSAWTTRSTVVAPEITGTVPVGLAVETWTTEAGRTVYADEFTTTYSAADTTAPTYEAAPAIGTETGTTIPVTATLNEGGTIYSIALTDGTTAPTDPTQARSWYDTGAGSNNVVAIATSAATASTQATMTLTGLTSETNYDVYAWAEDDEGTPNVVASLTTLSATTADVTAPVLSSPTLASQSGGSITIGVTTDEASSAGYHYITANASETAADIVANGTQVSLTVGANTENITGLTSGTYYAHWVQDDAASNRSNVVTSASFTIDTTAPVLSSPTATNPQAAGTVTIGATTDEAGLASYLVSANASEVAGTIKAAANTLNVTPGAFTQNITGLSAGDYYGHWVQDDSEGNESNVVSSAQFTIPAPAVMSAAIDQASRQVGQTAVLTLTDAPSSSGRTLDLDGVDVSSWITAQDATTVTFNAAALHLITGAGNGLAYSTAHTLTVTDGAESDTVSFTVTPAADTFTVTAAEPFDAGGILENDEPVASDGDQVHAFKLSGTGTFANLVANGGVAYSGQLIVRYYLLDADAVGGAEWLGPIDATLDGVAPTFLSVTINSAGTAATANIAEAVTATDTSGFSITGTTATYSSGSGGSQLTYSLSPAVKVYESPPASYTRPANGFEDQVEFPLTEITNLRTILGAVVTPASINARLNQEVMVSGGGGGGTADILAPRLALIQANAAANGSNWERLLIQTERERTGAGTNDGNMLVSGYLRIVANDPTDSNLAAFTSWYTTHVNDSLATRNFNPTGGSAPRDSARNQMFSWQLIYIWDLAQDVLGSSFRSTLLTAIELWFDQWKSFYDSVKATFLPQDSDETAMLLLNWTLWAENLTGTKATQAAAFRDEWLAEVESEYLNPATGAFALGAWGESPGYDDETPLLYNVWTVVADHLSLTEAYADYPKDFARWVMYTLMADMNGRVYYNDTNSVVNDSSVVYYSNSASQFSFFAHNKRVLDNAAAALSPTDEEYRAIMWAGDVFDSDLLVNNEEFADHAWRVFAESATTEGTRVNPWTSLSWPLHHKSGQSLIARSDDTRNATQMFFWTMRPWRVDHFMWQSGSFELFDGDGSDNTLAITMNVPNNRYGADPNEPSPANTIYIESPPGNVYPGHQARRNDYNSSYGEPQLIGWNGVDGAYAFGSHDMTAIYYVVGATGSSLGAAEYATQVRRTVVWLPGAKQAIVHDRIELDNTQVADIGQTSGYTRESMILWRAEALPADNTGGFVKANAWGKDFIYKQVGDATTQTLVNESTSGHAALIPVSAHEKFHIEESITSDDADLISILAYGDTGLSNPTETAVTVVTGDIVAHEVDNRVFIFNRGVTPISTTVEVTLGGATTGKDVYAVGLATGTAFTVSNPSGNNIRLAAGSGANPVSEGSKTFGILVDTSTL